MKKTKQCLAELQLQDQQPHLAEKADLKLDIKTHERVEVAAADYDKYGDISSVRVDDDPMRVTRFGDESIELLAPEKGARDPLVDEGAEAPKPHLPPGNARMLTYAAGGLLLTGTASTLQRLEPSFTHSLFLRAFAKKNDKRQ